MSNNEDRSVLLTLVKSMVCALVDNESEVDVKEIAGKHNVVWEVTVADDDMALAIGKDGAHVKAMRTILTAACRKMGVKYYFEVLSKSGQQGDPRGNNGR
jgi:predicted RNA-binding protein YlqC (UPF0109 family)